MGCAFKSTKFSRGVANCSISNPIHSYQSISIPFHIKSYSNIHGPEFTNHSVHLGAKSD